MRNSRVPVFHLSFPSALLVQGGPVLAQYGTRKNTWIEATAPLNSEIRHYTLGASLPAITIAGRLADMISRLTLLGTFMSLAWFLTAHILEYTSVNDCRHTSPHLWWTTFGILCILYLMVLEIFLLGLLVFVFGPVLYVSLYALRAG